jgi:tetratricopeptide (TPR) repeat protein
MILINLGADMKRFRRVWALASGILVLSLSSVWAQKPKSKGEIEAIQAVQAAKTPDDQIKAIENVLTKYADTEFKNVLLDMAMQIEEQKGDFAQTVFYAERLLEADPKSAPALVTLAGETARHTREFDLDKEEKLTKVDKWAKAAIDAAPTSPKPNAAIPDAQWDSAKKDMQSQAYVAMGMAASLRKKYDDSITDYKQALAVGATQDPANFVRLGQSCLDANKLDEASDAFDKALSAPNASPQVKSIAQAKKDETAKRKSGGAKPPGGF